MVLRLPHGATTRVRPYILRRYTFALQAEVAMFLILCPPSRVA
jgi:hypothetical protein